MLQRGLTQLLLREVIIQLLLSFVSMFLLRAVEEKGTLMP